MIRNRGVWFITWRRNWIAVKEFWRQNEILLFRVLNLFDFFLDLGGPDDERSPDCVLHGLDAGVDVVQGQSVVPLLLLHFEGGGGSVDVAIQNNTDRTNERKKEGLLLRGLWNGGKSEWRRKQWLARNFFSLLGTFMTPFSGM